MSRQLIQKKCFVGGYGVLRSRELGHHRPAARGDQNFFGRNPGIANSNMMLVNDTSSAIEMSDPRIIQQALVDSIETRDLGILVIEQCRPVKTRGRFSPAEPLRLVIIFRVMGCVDEEFLGDTTHINARTSHVAIFRSRHSGAILGTHAGGPDPS